MRLILSALALFWASAVLAKDNLPASVITILDQGEANCAAFENGAFSVDNGGLSHMDLNGDGVKDWVVDEFHFRCSSAASLYCGTGGCMAHFIIGDVITKKLTKGWQVMPFGPMTVLLTQIHGTECGGSNLRPCVEALVWDENDRLFATVKPLP
ncbi:MAG: hypothetical protein ACPGNV_00870 [Mangrovicoccus sp.]